MLSPAEAATAIADYAGAHPKSWTALRSLLENTLGTSIDENGTELPLIRFDLVAGRTERITAPNRLGI